jgi:hypothetical protein
MPDFTDGFFSIEYNDLMNHDTSHSLEIDIRPPFAVSPPGLIVTISSHGPSQLFMGTPNSDSNNVSHRSVSSRSQDGETLIVFHARSRNHNDSYMFQLLFRRVSHNPYQFRFYNISISVQVPELCPRELYARALYVGVNSAASISQSLALVADAAVVTSVFTGSATMIAAANRLLIIRKLTTCGGDDDWNTFNIFSFPLRKDPSENDEQRMVLRGACIANWFGFFVFCIILSSWVLAESRKKALSAAMASAKFPSMLVLPFVALLQPTTSANLILARQSWGVDSMDTLIGISSQCAIVLVCVFMAYRLINHQSHMCFLVLNASSEVDGSKEHKADCGKLNDSGDNFDVMCETEGSNGTADGILRMPHCESQPDSSVLIQIEPSPADGQSTLIVSTENSDAVITAAAEKKPRFFFLRRMFSVVFKPLGEWKAYAGCQHWLKQNIFLVEDYAIPHFFCVDIVATSLIIGVLGALPSSDKWWCRVQASGLILMSAIFVFICLRLRPYLRSTMFIYQIVMNLLSSGAGFASLLFIETYSQTAADISAVIGFIIAAANLIQTIILFVEIGERMRNFILRRKVVIDSKAETVEETVVAPPALIAPAIMELELDEEDETTHQTANENDEDIVSIPHYDLVEDDDFLNDILGGDLPCPQEKKQIFGIEQDENEKYLDSILVNIPLHENQTNGHRTKKKIASRRRK